MDASFREGEILEIVIEGVANKIVDGVEDVVDEKLGIHIQRFEYGFAFAAFH